MVKPVFGHRLAWVVLAALLAGCGGQNSSDVVQPVSSSIDDDPDEVRNQVGGGNTSLWDAFRRGPEEQNVSVNRYLWAASLEVLNFLPVQSVDPFTGVIVTGYGTPPGSGRSYRATVLIDDPALDARSLNVSLQTRSGPASAATVRAVENAILSRARQMRVADNAF